MNVSFEKIEKEDKIKDAFAFIDTAPVPTPEPDPIID